MTVDASYYEANKDRWRGYYIRRKQKEAADPKVKEKKRAAVRKWREKNPEAGKKYMADSREVKRSYVNGLKETTPCAHCGGLFPACVMDYDHLPGEDKVSGVSVLVKSAAPIEMIDAEIAKCQLLCANCHRIQTHLRRAIKP